MATKKRPYSITPCSSAGSSNSSGVMVSPGRFVNLSNGPITLNQQIESQVDMAMRRHGFMQNSLLCKDLMVDAIMTAQHYRANPYHSYQGKKVTRQSFGTVRPNNRNQEGIRMYLLAALWRAWMLGTNTKPTVNNRDYADTRFVKFVTDVAASMGMGNVIKNLERYQSYRIATFRENERVIG